MEKVEYDIYSNPVKGRRKRTTKRKRTVSRRATVRRNPVAKAAVKTRYRRRRNPVSQSKGLAEIAMQVVAGAAGAVGVAFAANKVAQQMGKTGTTLQGLIGLGLGAGMIFAGKKTKNVHLANAGLGAAGFAGLYTANKITVKNNKGSFDNLLAGNVTLAGDPEVRYEIEAPAVDSGVFAGYDEPAGIRNGVFSN